MSIAYPDWVPETVKLMAGALPENEIKSRLLTDPKMKNVWIKLLESKVSADSYKNLWGYQTLEGFDLDDIRFSLAEKAAASILSTSVLEFQKDHIVHIGFIDSEITAWKVVSSECRTIGRVDGAPQGNKDLASALETVARHFDGLVDKFATLSGPRVIERSGRGGGGDEIRHQKNLVRVRSASLIAFSDMLYECRHRTALSTICSVGLDRSVSPKDVENYRNGMKS